VRAKLREAAEQLRASFDAPGSNKVLAAATATAPVIPDVVPGDEAAADPVSAAVAVSIGSEEIAPTPDRESEAALAEFLDRQVLPYLRSARARKTGLAKAQFSDDAFRFVKLHVTMPYRRLVDQIQAWCDERRMLDLQTKLHHWLHGWLFVHVPLSFLLVILTAWHAFVTLFYY
jgi:hypothetical protein